MEDTPTTAVDSQAESTEDLQRDPVRTVILASMIGTAIEFFDFYAYGTAAATYFPTVFFPKVTPAIALILSLLTFGVAFVARPLGSLIFGHFGDKLGRKKTLVVSLLTMGTATVVIGVLPSYATLGLLAVLLLCLARFIQGIGLGGEWSGAVLVATENAPANKRALYGAFPELGAPIGFFLSNGLYFVLESTLKPAQMQAFGWRIPFLASAVLVVIGLVVREKMQETPLFRLAMDQSKVQKSPLAEVFKHNWASILKGTFIMGVAYTFFYLLTTWSLSYVTVAMNLPTKEWLLMLMLGVVLFGAMIVVASLFADRLGRKGVLVTGTVMIIAFALAFPFFLQGKGNVGGGIFFIFVGFFIYGIIYGPVGALLPELFPTATRYSGSGIAYNLAAIIGAAFAPTIASFLVDRYGIHSVGFYLALMAAISLVALLTTKETKSIDYTK